MTSASASRVTRSRRSLGLAVALLCGALAVVGALRAQVPGQKPPASVSPAAAAPPTDGAPVAASAAAAPAAPTAEASPAAAAPPADGKPARGSGASPSHFEPTEKVRADFDVSFPVDI